MNQDWAPTRVTYLDSATYGIPCTESVAAFNEVLRSWSVGEYAARACDDAVARARGAFARLHGVHADDVAIGHQVAPFVAAFAAAVPQRGKVVTAEGDFTSLLYPLAASGREIVSVPLTQLADAVDRDTAIVAVAAVQSADGSVADLDAIADAAAEHNAFSLVDSTQASGWLPLDASRFDAVVAGGYKWLSHPRGTAFMALGRRLADTVPITANWYAADEPWESCYGLPLRIADEARRFDVSPAWLNWHAAAVALERLEAIGIAAIYEHNTALASRVREALELEPADSAIVALEVPSGTAARLNEAGIKVSERAGRLRISCHHYNDHGDIDRLLDIVATANQRPAVSSSS